MLVIEKRCNLFIWVLSTLQELPLPLRDETKMWNVMSSWWCLCRWETCYHITSSLTIFSSKLYFFLFHLFPKGSQNNIKFFFFYFIYFPWYFQNIKHLYLYFLKVYRVVYFRTSKLKFSNRFLSTNHRNLKKKSGFKK